MRTVIGPTELFLMRKTEKSWRAKPMGMRRKVKDGRKITFRPLILAAKIEAKPEMRILLATDETREERSAAKPQPYWRTYEQKTMGAEISALSTTSVSIKR